MSFPLSVQLLKFCNAVALLREAANSLLVAFWLTSKIPEMLHCFNQTAPPWSGARVTSINLPVLSFLPSSLDASYSEVLMLDHATRYPHINRLRPWKC